MVNMQYFGFDPLPSNIDDNHHHLFSTLPETNKSPLQIGWLGDYFPFGARTIFRCELLVSGRVGDTFSL